MRWEFSVAPMLDWTDRHARYLLRLIAPDIKLYTEMVTASALLYGDAARLLTFHPAEKYLALQLGGSDAKALAHCAQLGESYGYNEINLNVGCPSSRVSAGRFGACLMLEPYVVAECIAAMSTVVSIPVTVKCRIGVDHQDSYEQLQNFIRIVASAGCKTFIIHARKAWLSGLSPKQNREVPPLNYDVVRQIKIDFPHLRIILNGGIKNLIDIKREYVGVDGMMIGRAAYHNPYFLAEIQKEFFLKTVLSRNEVVHYFVLYMHDRLKEGVRLKSMTRHLLGLFYGQKNGALFRRYLSEMDHQHTLAGINQALQIVSESKL